MNTLADVSIVIPSAGRAGNVRTLAHCASQHARNLFTLAVPAHERAAYEGAASAVAGQAPARIISVPSAVRGIAATRQWLTEHTIARVLVQVSDDVKFFTRVAEGGGIKFVPVVDLPALTDMFAALAGNAVVCGHSGVSRRATPPKEAWSYGDGWIDYAHRACDVYAHDVDLLARLGVRWDRVPVMEDFDVTLQLLRAGHANAVLYRWCWDQPASNSAGGCSSYRTEELQAQGAHALHALHPDYVTVVQKEAKNWEGFAARTDVRVAWKKAYAAACTASPLP